MFRVWLSSEDFESRNGLRDTNSISSLNHVDLRSQDLEKRSLISAQDPRVDSSKLDPLYAADDLWIYARHEHNASWRNLFRREGNVYGVCE